MNVDSDKHVPMSPKFAAAGYFAIFALLFLLFTKYTLLSLQDNLLLPLLPSILIALVTGVFVGGFFGELLARESHWLRLMLIGCLLALLAIVLATFGILVHTYLYDAAFFTRLQRWQDYFVVYGVLFLSILFVAGLWLIPLTALAAVYFNKSFLPGLLAADKKRIQEEDKQDP